MRRAEDIIETLWGTRVSSGTVSQSHRLEKEGDAARIQERIDPRLSLSGKMLPLSTGEMEGCSTPSNRN